MRVLVTGGAGYIGGVVTEQLLAAGHQAVILDNLSRGHRAVVPPGVPFVHGDVGDAAVVQAALRTHRIEAVMHLAAFALVAESVAHPEMYQQNNVAAGRVLLDATLAAGVRRFVFSSSCATYGHPAVTPITEDTPQQPVNPYGRTKLEFEGGARPHSREPAVLQRRGCDGAPGRGSRPGVAPRSQRARRGARHQAPCARVRH